jgi:hypothetical protein
VPGPFRDAKSGYWAAILVTISMGRLWRSAVVQQQNSDRVPVAPREVVEGYFNAVARRDFPAARRLLADRGFRYRSPIGSFDNADDFVADLWRLGSIMESITLCRAFVAGNELCHIVEVRTRMSELVVTRLAQWSKVEDGRIQEIEAFFDGQRYAALFQHDPPPAA